MFIKRNSDGKISAVSLTADNGFIEAEATDSAELDAFIGEIQPNELSALDKSDAGMARVLEDVINLLVERGTIRFTDLPEAAQTKMLSRRELRGRYSGINLLDDNEDFGM